MIRGRGSFGEHQPCTRDRDVLVDLALGQMSGEERSELVDHVASCPRCAAELQRLSAAADALLAVTPELDPPLGFEVRVLEHLRSLAPTRVRRSPRVLAAAAAVTLAAMGAGIGIGFAASGGNPPTTAAARSARLVDDGVVRGQVVLTASSHWMLVMMNDLPVGASIECHVVTSAGKTLDVGSYWPETKRTSAWAVRLPVSAGKVRAALITNDAGVVIARATFPV